MNQAYELLIESLKSEGYLSTPEIIEAFSSIDRSDFVPQTLKDSSYDNTPLPIGHGQTISQPLTVAFMVELLEPKEGEKILEIGCGSGWQTAILGNIVGGGKGKNSISPQKPLVYGIERIDELREIAETNVMKYSYIESGIVQVIKGDGSKGFKKAAPYDKIIAGAASLRRIPEEWKKQLKIGGRIVSPVDHSIVVIDKKTKKEYDQKEYFGFSFVPLILNN